MSVYNGEYGGKNWLTESVNSILNQTYKDFEFIIINDGSTDNTQNILEKINDSRIKIYCQENIGLTKSLNRGLELCNGEYIARQDADDISYLNRLEKQLLLLKSDSKIGLVGSFFSFIDDQSNTFFIKKVYPDKVDIKHLAGTVGPGMLTKTSILYEVGKYTPERIYAQDFDLYIKIRKAGYIIKNIEEVLYGYRVHNQRISVIYEKEQLKDAQKIKEKYE